MKILLVDDFSTLRKSITALLNRAGYNKIIECSSGINAIDELKNNVFDIVITDIRMPDVNGIELTKHIRIMYPNTQVLVMTEKKQKNLIILAAHAGANGYIEKPFMKKELIEKIHKTQKRKMKC
jgi:two-component system chemotaxis response regulator CheY